MEPKSQNPTSGGSGGQVPYNAATTTTVITVMEVAIMSPTPTRMHCPQCKSEVMTEVTPVNGNFAYLLCLILFLVGCWCGCCLIPFFVQDCKDVEHRCPNCKHLFGRYKKLDHVFK